MLTNRGESPSEIEDPTIRYSGLTSESETSESETESEYISWASNIDESEPVHKTTTPSESGKYTSLLLIRLKLPTVLSTSGSSHCNYQPGM